MHAHLIFAVLLAIALSWKGLLIALLGAGIVGTFVTAPHPFPLIPATSPDSDTIDGQSANLPLQFEVLTGTTDVIQGGGGTLNAVPGAGAAVPICGTSFIESAVVDAATLAAPAVGDPAAGGNDGLTITIIDNGGHAHTVTAPANSIVPAHHLITFNGTQGSFVELIARNGKWIPLAVSGVVIS